MTIQEAEEGIGRRVVYLCGGVYDRGVITSTRGDVVFVRYGFNAHSKATFPSQLEFE